MKAHAITTGKVKITQKWRMGREHDPLRLVGALMDDQLTDWLPIYCYVIEHPEGLIVIDTGIPANANDPIWFPPWMRLVQQAAFFEMTPEQEIGPQLQARGLSPKDVRWVVLTHLHQDHEGGLHHFPKAEMLVSRQEWETASGLKGRMAGYLNNRWPKWLSPKLTTYKDGCYGPFEKSQAIAKGVYAVSTPGHSAGHQSVIVEEDDHVLFFAGDASYSQELLLQDEVDGVGPDPKAQHETHRTILRFAARTPTVYLPSHEWDSERRLMARETIPLVNDSLQN